MSHTPFIPTDGSTRTPVTSPPTVSVTELRFVSPGSFIAFLLGVTIEATVVFVTDPTFVLARSAIVASSLGAASADGLVTGVRVELSIGIKGV